MKRTFRRPIALFLMLALLLSLLPGMAFATNESDSVVVDSSGWTDAQWGLTPIITPETNGIKVSVADSTEAGKWRSVAIQKDIQGVTGIGELTMQFSGGDSDSSLNFQVYLGGNDPDDSSTWVQYQSAGTYNSGTVTFEEFYKKKDDGNFETDNPSDLSSFSPTQLVITVGSDSTLPSEMVFSEITITAPAVKTKCTVTFSATEDGKVKGNDNGIGFTTAAFSVDGTNPVSDTTLTVDSGTKITVLGTVWLKEVAGDYLQSVTVDGVEQSIEKGKNYEITVTEDTEIVADYKYLEVPPVGTECTVTLSATEDGKVKGDDGGTGFTTAAFSVDGTNPVSDTTLTVDSGTKITVLGKVWPQDNVQEADYLDSVKVNDQIQTITKGQNFEVTITDETTNIVADYQFLNAPPEEEPETGVLSAAYAFVGTAISADVTATCQWYRTAKNEAKNGTAISEATNTSYTPVESDVGSYLYCVADGKTYGPAPVFKNDTPITLSLFSGSKALGADSTADSSLSDAVNPSNKFPTTMIAPGGKFVVKYTDTDSATLKLCFAEWSSGKWVEAEGTVGDAGTIEFDYDACVTAFGGSKDFSLVNAIQIKNYTGSPITITSIQWVGYDNRTGYVPGERPSAPENAEEIVHIVPWTQDGRITAKSDQTSAGYVYLKHAGGVFDASQIRKGGYFYLLYEGKASSDAPENFTPAGQIFLSFSSNSGNEKTEWVKVEPTESEAAGSDHWYYSKFSVEKVEEAFGTNFGRMDQIGIWLHKDLDVNARETKLYFVNGTGDFVEPDHTTDPVTGFPWTNQFHKQGGIAFIGDSIVHNPRVNSDVGLTPDKGDWNAILGREDCDNYGIGGETSVHIAGRFAQLLTNDCDYRQIVTLFGINNLGLGDEETVTRQVIDDYTTVLNMAKEAVEDDSKQLKKVFVISLLPSTPLTYEGAQDRIVNVNAKLKALCESDPYKSFVIFVNAYPKLLYHGDKPLEGCTTAGEPHGDPKYFFPTDGLHPNAAGYKKIAEVLNPLLGGEYTSTEGVTGDVSSFGASGWTYGGEDWSNGGTSTGSLSTTSSGMLKVNVHFNSTNWSQAAITNWSNNGHPTSGKDVISMDVYLEKSAVDASRGTMLAQIYEFGKEVPLNISGTPVDIDGVEYYKSTLSIKGTFPDPFQNFAILLIARNSSFNGNILVDNIAFQKSSGDETVIKITKPENSDEHNFSNSNQSDSVDFSKNETARTPIYNNGGHIGRLFKGAKITLKITLNNVTSDLSGKMKITVTIKGTNGTSKDVETTIDASAFQAVEEVVKARDTSSPMVAEVEMDIPADTVAAVENIKTISVKAESDENNTFNYNGTLDLTELTVTNGSAEITKPSGGGGNNSSSSSSGGGSAQSAVSLPHTWDFAKSADGWKYDKAWDHDYSGGSKTKVKVKDGRLKVDVDFSKDGDKSWSQLAVTLWHNSGMKVKGATHVSLDFFYRPDLLDGGFSMKLFSNAGIDVLTSLESEEAEQVEIDNATYHKVTMDFIFPALQSNKVQDLAICLAGQNTTYQGTMFIDNLTIDNVAAVTYVNSTLKPKKDNSTLSVSGNTLITASGENVTIPSQITVVDGNADASVRALYAYLKAMGDSKDVLFGQQYNFNQKAGSSDLSDSDTYDVVGDYAAIFGLDGLALSDNEFSASQCNELYGTSYPSTAAGHVAAAAYLSNQAIERGAIVTLSVHMPNFSTVASKQTSETETYAQYDFSGYTPNTLTGDVINEVLPGGKYNQIFNAYLDMVADYAKQVNGAVLFRPFHENTGSWFWWGKAFCDPTTYQNVFRYTVEYLRDIKGVHNFLYVYGPSSDAASIEDYAERYPGDSWVDMVGFDMYNNAPDVNSSWLQEFEKELNIVEQFAKNHGKLLAVTETGAANATVKGDSQTALLKSGNKDLDWYNRLLNVVSKSSASYLLVWANFGQTSGFYTPYVLSVNKDGSLYGHEMLDNFISYYNDSRSVFAADQKAALSKIPSASAKAANDKAEGYFTSPLSGRRVLEATEFVARMTHADGAEVQFLLHGNNDKTVTLNAQSTDGVYYRAQINTQDLESLGHFADGSADLVVNGQTQQTINLIYNIAEPVLDRKIIDSFDTYYGVNGLLNKAWTVNSANGCSITATLDQGIKFNGDSSLKLEYALNKDGYAGVSFSRKTDWTGCNALQFWTVPDKNCQKTVVQITASGQVYEVYLNDYPDYVNAEGPVLMTIPLAEFVQRDTSDQPKGGLVTDCKDISGAGLWVNAIENDAMVNGKVSGVLRYDNIVAIENGPSQVTVSKAVGLYSDVPADAWFYDAVCFAAEKGLMIGYNSGLFGPSDKLSRAQLAEILYRKEGKPTVTASNSFVDVAADAWYANAVTWAAASGTVNGYGNGCFGPNDDITREQFTVMLWHCEGSPKPNAETLNFDDANTISSYALDAMRWAVENGILNGDDNGKLDPTGSATRAQAAQILKNYIER